MIRPAALATVVALLLLVVGSPAAAHPGPGVDGYAWVSPPDTVPATAPRAEGREVQLTEDLLATGRVDVWTPDLQALVTVTSDRPVQVALTPLDPASFPTIDGLLASGNAYDITLRPVDGGPVGDATVVLRPPHPVTHVARWDGSDRWTVQPVTQAPDGTVTVPWVASTAYVAAAPRLDGHASTLGALVHDPVRIALGLGGLLLLAVGLVRRQRRPATPAASGSG